MRTNRLAEARAALKHLPAELATPAEVHRLAAMAGIEVRRSSIASGASWPPSSRMPPRISRRWSVSRPWSQPAAKTAAAERRRRRAEIERDQRRYRELYRRNQPARDAEEMARLAERLGHRFEAILFLTAAIAEEPDRAELRENLHRLKEVAREQDGRSQGLVDSLPKDCGGDKPRSGQAGQGEAGNESSFR